MKTKFSRNYLKIQTGISTRKIEKIFWFEGNVHLWQKNFKTIRTTRKDFLSLTEFSYLKCRFLRFIFTLVFTYIATYLTMPKHIVRVLFTFSDASPMITSWVIIFAINIFSWKILYLTVVIGFKISRNFRKCINLSHHIFNTYGPNRMI